MSTCRAWRHAPLLLHIDKGVEGSILIRLMSARVIEDRYVSAMGTSINDVEKCPMCGNGGLEDTLISLLSGRLGPNPVFASCLSWIAVPKSKGMVTDQRKRGRRMLARGKDHPLLRAGVHEESASFMVDLALGSRYLMGLFSLICGANCSVQPASTLHSAKHAVSLWCRPDSHRVRFSSAVEM
ncbi:hypothetical protein E1301_Tti011708 [Triplophysa tibetana]|uniref:Uncharacterized protein n=1 Tax=Triplophysa tibetana TaxID=1572043 RepID=A0A5A9PDV7_9TELE|nr:hypothetical protein E1301_Tti011708 [Triplophysa tibetana]